MSFAERHKRWLLPLLGTALAGVVWLNLPARAPAAAPKPVPTTAATPVEAGPAQAGAREPDPAGPAPELPAPGVASVEDNDTLPLLLAGRQPVAGALRNGPRPPVLHPDQWAGLAQGPAWAPSSAPAGSAPAPAAAPRTLDFTLESETRQEAWVGGRGYRPGDTLPGGYRLRRLTPDGALLAGPDGEHLVPLGPPPQAPRAAAPAPPAPLSGDPP